MKSIQMLGNYPISLPLSADDITELHAARLLLLIHHCGSNNNIHGLTKLAKIDFFVRYPGFFQQVAEYLNKPVTVMGDQTESAMVRHHYGPWDKRYYQVLAFLESRGLITVEKHGTAFDFSLTELGKEKCNSLSKSEPFISMVHQMKAVKKILGRKSGTQLRDLIYKVFDEEITQRKLGDVI